MGVSVWLTCTVLMLAVYKRGCIHRRVRKLSERDEALVDCVNRCFFQEK